MQFVGTLTGVLRRYILRPRPKRIFDLVLEKNAGIQDKQALLSYIVHPFFIPRESPRFLVNINNWFALEMVRELNRLGYRVDVVDYMDRDFLPEKEYDLFIGHGGINFEGIARHLPCRTMRLYFSTGCHWEFHNRQEDSRFKALRERRGTHLPPDRFIGHREEGALLDADGIIAIGNEYTRGTYAGFSPVIMLNGASLPDDHYERHEKDFCKGRRHFLYFAANGPVHKGLDLLLEAFPQLDLHLWICSELGRDFIRAYYEELFHHPRIHTLGFMQPRSPSFYELMKQCNFVILPSCSEGQAQSVVECMNQGLIPVVSRQSGLSIDGCGVTLDTCSIEEITRTVKELSSLSSARCRELSRRTRRLALEEFSESRFRENLRDALRRLVEPTDRNNTES